MSELDKVKHHKKVVVNISIDSKEVKMLERIVKHYGARGRSPVIAALIRDCYYAKINPNAKKNKE